MQKMNYQFPRPRLLKTKFEPSGPSGFYLSLKEMLFESVYRQQTMMDNSLSYKLPYGLS